MTPARMQELLAPYVDVPLDEQTLAQLLIYLDLILAWNARTNLTAIRYPETLVRRQIGESLFCARHIPADCATLLDFGSGAGFPGVPIAIKHPELRVTLAESQGKKAAFLREVARQLSLANTTVIHGRVEDLPPERTFSAVTLRAVDGGDSVLSKAFARVTVGGRLFRFLGRSQHQTETTGTLQVPESDGYLEITTRQS